MQRSRFLVAVVLAGAACSRGPDPVDTCVAAIAAARDADVGGRFRVLAEGCKTIYAEPACREAWSRAATADPAEALSIAVFGCAEAYCPKLDEPRPALCGAPGGAASLAQWPELQARILERELSIVQRAKLAAAGVERVLAPSEPIEVALPPVSPPRETSLQVRLRQPVPGTLSLGVGDGADETLPEAALADRLGAKLAALPPGGRVVLAVDGAVPYAFVVQTIDVLRASGRTDFALAVEPGG